MTAIREETEDGGRRERETERAEAAQLKGRERDQREPRRISKVIFCNRTEEEKDSVKEEEETRQNIRLQREILSFKLSAFTVVGEEEEWRTSLFEVREKTVTTTIMKRERKALLSVGNASKTLPCRSAVVVKAFQILENNGNFRDSQRSCRRQRQRCLDDVLALREFFS